MHAWIGEDLETQLQSFHRRNQEEEKNQSLCRRVDLEGSVFLQIEARGIEGSVAGILGLLARIQVGILCVNCF